MTLRPSRKEACEELSGHGSEGRIPKPGWVLKLSTSAFVLAGSLMLYGYYFPSTNHYMDVPPIMSMVRPELYRNDYYVQEMLRFTPRYYYTYMVYILAKSGLAVPIVYFLYYVAAFSSFVLGLYALGNMFGRSRLSGGVLAFLGLAATNGTIGGSYLFEPTPLPYVFAIAFAIWGVYFCFRQRWVPGYFLFGLASLLQFLIGVLPGMLMAALLILDAKKRGTLRIAGVAFIVLVAMASLVYVPMLVAGTTDTGLIDNAQFVYVYGQVRHPHHIIPSKWGMDRWANLVLFGIAGLLCIKRAQSLGPEDKVGFSLLVGASAFTLLLGYIFVELYPVALVAKLQFARTTPFAQLVILIAVSALVREHYERGNTALSALLLAAPTLPYGGGLLFAWALGSVALRGERRVQGVGRLLSEGARSTLLAGITVGGSILVLGMYPTPASILQGLFRVAKWPVLFVVLTLPFFLETVGAGRKVRATTHTLAIGSVVFLVLGSLGALPGRASELFYRKMMIYIVPQDEVTRLALRFRERSSKDAVVLVPPSVESFKFYAERAVVVDFKCIPYTDRGIREWRNRLEAVLGGPVTPPAIWRTGAYEPLDELFGRRKGSELMEVARRFDADYILTRAAWHRDMKGVPVDREGSWVLYRIGERGG